AHNLKVAGSNPAPATNMKKIIINPMHSSGARGLLSSDLVVADTALSNAREIPAGKRNRSLPATGRYVSLAETRTSRDETCITPN
ncbi:hypothetical protein, partial [Novosphingobium arvoryzae]|uniref:hypothetical protein n=1 Tax=Novosphingobium arvoryzae TaxID=1256514 RepID=UPI0035AF31E2